MKSPDISIILVSLKKGFVVNCLKSLIPATDNLNSEIILIDNNSTDNVGKSVKKEFPHVKVIRREKDSGFGENNNVGMRLARGRYVLLLNDDTLLIDKNILKEMIAWMDSHPGVGLASCALLNFDKKTLQGSGGYFPTLFKVFAWMTFLDDIPGIDKFIKPYHPMHSSSPFSKGDNYFSRSHKQDWVTGAFFLMRKSAMNQVGYFDEDFFLYVEEVEYSLRLAKAGWETWYLPKWKIVHYGMATTGGEKATIFEMQNIKLLYKKHYPEWQLPMLNIFLKIGIILRILLYTVANPSVSKTYAKALYMV